MTGAPFRLTGSRMAAGLTMLVVVVAAAAATGLIFGATRLDLGAAGTAGDSARLILTHVRLPRVLLAALVGGALSASGAALQPMLRNPLASPDIIGVSGGAALAAVASMAFLPWLLHPAAVPLVAFGGAAASSALVYRLSLVRGRLDPYSQILVGVIFNTFAAALIMLINSLVDVTRAQSIVFWLMGGIAIHSYSVIALVALLVGLGCALLVAEAPRLNLLVLGDRDAERLGVDLERTRRRVFTASSLIVGAVVALTGVITFVGLIVPHMLRRLLGADNRLLVPAAFLGGAAFLVLCDAAARSLFAPTELPVGALTAMTGGPYFVYLLRRRPPEESRWSG